MIRMLISIGMVCALASASQANDGAHQGDRVKVGADEDEVSFWAADHRFQCFGRTFSLKIESGAGASVGLGEFSVSDGRGKADLTPVARTEIAKFQRVTIVQPNCRRSDESAAIYLMGSRIGELDGKPARRVLEMRIVVRKDAAASGGWSVQFLDVTERR
jgi:hypothetical protein